MQGAFPVTAQMLKTESDDACAYFEEDIKSLCEMLEELAELIHDLPENSNKVIKHVTRFSTLQFQNFSLARHVLRGAYGY